MTKRKPSRITNHQNRILKKKKEKKKLNNLYNYTPTFAFKTHTFAWDDSVFFVFFFQGNIKWSKKECTSF